MKEVKQWVATMESSLLRLEQTETKYQAELDAALAQFRELTGEAENVDKAELTERRQFLRKPNTQDPRCKYRASTSANSAPSDRFRHNESPVAC